VIQQRLQTPQHAGLSIGAAVDALDVIGTRQMQGVLRDRSALMLQQAGRVFAENFLDF
jgi:hypothetical protein